MRSVPQCLKLRPAVTDVWSDPRDDSFRTAEPAVWCAPVSEPTGGRDRLTLHIYHSEQVCARLTEVRVSKKPCLWLRFQRLAANWLSLLLRTSPWANRQPKRENARPPCLRTPWKNRKDYASGWASHYILFKSLIYAQLSLGKVLRVRNHGRISTYIISPQTL